MQNKFILLLTFVMLFSLTGVMALTSYCGDDYCSDTFGEADPLSTSYCPLDCGVRTNSTWCDETYSRDCPVCTTCPSCTCTSCPSCDTSRIQTTELNNWCTSTGYSKSIQPLAISGSESSGNFSIWWLIFLIIGLVGGYFIKHYQDRKCLKRCKR